MEPKERYDLVVAGGGLAGLCLALQVRQARPETSVLVVERSTHPAPEAAHKVGESSVEIGSHYLSEVLGLSELLDGELRKFGLRFFMSRNGNTDVAERLECGPGHFLTVPSYQIDRGGFETALAKRAAARGVAFSEGHEVTSIELGANGADHVLGVAGASGSHAVRCRWFVDASGRRTHKEEYAPE